MSLAAGRAGNPFTALEEFYIRAQNEEFRKLLGQAILRDIQQGGSSIAPGMPNHHKAVLATLAADRFRVPLVSAGSAGP